MSRLRPLPLAALLACLAAGTADAQTVRPDSARANPDGSFVVWIQGTPHVAYGPAELRRQKSQVDSLETLKRIRVEQDSIIGIREREARELARQLERADGVIDQQRRVIATQDRLVRELEAAAGNRFAFGLGGGWGENAGFGAIAEVSWRDYGLWALAAEEPGLMVGAKIRLAKF